MNPLLTVLAVLGVVVIHVFFAGLGVLIWIAMGESDVNGDPERDAGIDPFQPQNQPEPTLK